MTEIDTSAQAVERLADNAENIALAGRNSATGCAVQPWLLETHAATLRALAAERDMWRDRLAKAERDELRAAWLRVIQFENSCIETGQPCKAKLCGCEAEQETLIADARKGSGSNE